MRRGFSVWTRALPLINQAATTIFWGIAKVPLCLIFDSRRFLLRHVQVCIVPIVTFQCAFPHPGRASVPRTHEGETLVSQHPGFLPRGKPKKHSGPPQVLNSWSVKKTLRKNTLPKTHWRASHWFSLNLITKSDFWFGLLSNDHCTMHTYVWIPFHFLGG